MAKANRAPRPQGTPPATRRPTPLHVLDRTKREELEKRLAAVPKIDSPGAGIPTYQAELQNADLIIRRLERKVTVLDTNLEHAYAWFNRAVAYIEALGAEIAVYREALGLPVTAKPFEPPPERVDSTPTPPTVAGTSPATPAVDDATQAGEPRDDVAQAVGAD